MNENRVQESILIVDDMMANVEVLKNVLSEEGFDVIAAGNGRTALMVAERKSPDLILLDICMPDLSGYDVCKKLKGNPETEGIPVIFISALDEVFDKVKGFRAGAIDYITKPIEVEEVLSRVNTHLENNRLQKRILEKNEKLEILNKEKDELMNFMAHDIRNPLTSIMMSADLVQRNLEGVGKDDSMNRLRDIKTSIKHIDSLLSRFLDVKRMEVGELPVTLRSFPLVPKIQTVISANETAIKAKNIILNTEIANSDLKILTDPNIFYQVFENLLSNGIKYSHKDSTLTVRAYERSDHIRVEVQDHGLGLSQDDIEKLFSKFTRLSAKPTAGERSLGIGLYIVKKLIDCVGAKVWAESEGKGKGSVFILHFPNNPKIYPKQINAKRGR